MQGLAEVEGNQMKIREATQRIERDVTPLSKEISRALQTSNNGGREELFYNAPAAHQRGDGSLDRDMEALIGSSHDMLQESLSLAIESEQIGVRRPKSYQICRLSAWNEVALLLEVSDWTDQWMFIFSEILITYVFHFFIHWL